MAGVGGGGSGAEVRSGVCTEAQHPALVWKLWRTGQRSGDRWDCVLISEQHHHVSICSPVSCSKESISSIKSPSLTRSATNRLELLTFMEKLNFKNATATLYLTFFLAIAKKIKNTITFFYLNYFIPWQGENNTPYLRYKHIDKYRIVRYKEKTAGCKLGVVRKKSEVIFHNSSIFLAVLRKKIVFFLFSLL